MKHPIRLGLACLCLLGLVTVWAVRKPPMVKRTGMVVWHLEVDPVHFETIVIDLAQAVRKDASAEQFRISYTYTALGFSGGGSILYDRTHHTVKREAENGGEGSRTEENFVYTSVSEQSLLRLGDELSQHLGEMPQNGDDYLDGLLRDGSKRTGSRKVFEGRHGKVAASSAPRRKVDAQRSPRQFVNPYSREKPGHSNGGPGLGLTEETT